MRPLLFAALVSLFAFPALVEAQETKKIKRRTNVISVEEIDQIRNEVSDAWELVKRLRPRFLSTRGAASFGNAASGRAAPYAKVVVDGVGRGELHTLRQIPVMHVIEIRYLSAADASTRYGTGYDGGAIEVKTR